MKIVIVGCGRVGAVLAGVLVIVVLSIATDGALHASGVYPPLGQPMADGLFALKLLDVVRGPAHRVHLHRVLAMNGQYDRPSGACDALEFLQPGKLVLLIQVRENRDAIDQVEGAVGIAQGRQGVVAAKAGEVHVLPAPGNGLCVDVRPVQTGVAGDAFQPAQRPAATGDYSAWTPDQA